MQLSADLILSVPGTLLGEGPVWDYRTEILWWVDILQGRLNAYEPSKGSNTTYEIGQYVGAAVPRKAGGLVLALHEGLAFFDPETKELDHFSDIEKEIKENRFNDAKCDAKGRFWAGSTQISHEQPVGVLYCLENESLELIPKIEGVTISNGMAWSSDQKTMYYIDTPTMEVKAYHFELETGEISFDRVALTFEESMGFPDGMTIDENDHLWVAFYGGNKVACFDPISGKQLHQVDVLGERTTSCAFGGPELDTLYITTAAKEGDPFGGALYACKPGVNGVKANFF